NKSQPSKRSFGKEMPQLLFSISIETLIVRNLRLRVETADHISALYRLLICLFDVSNPTTLTVVVQGGYFHQRRLMRKITQATISTRVITRVRSQERFPSAKGSFTFSP